MDPQPKRRVCFRCRVNQCGLTPDGGYRRVCYQCASARVVVANPRLAPTDAEIERQVARFLAKSPLGLLG